MPVANSPEQTATRAPLPGTQDATRPPPAPPVLLASRSPRRRQLLSEFGVQHECAEPLFDDACLAPGHVPAHWWVTALACLKAWACLISRPNLDRSTIVLGADTACVKDGRLIGTPRDAKEAEAIIRFLSGGSHRAVTGVALLTHAGHRDLWADDAIVHVGVLTDAQIDAYIESGLWHGKAGAYNLRERIDAGWPITFQGDPTAIMGLPMDRLMPSLAKLAATGAGTP